MEKHPFIYKRMLIGIKLFLDLRNKIRDTNRVSIFLKMKKEKLGMNSMTLFISPIIPVFLRQFK